MFSRGRDDPKARVSSPGQRGTAAHIRQYDDNNDRKKLTKDERKFVNDVIHDKSMEHNKKFDKKLDELKKKQEKKKK